MTEYQPEELLHPGEHWRDIIDASGRANVVIARDLGVTQKHLSQILVGHAMPSARLVVIFARLFDVSPELLWRAQCDYVLDQAIREIDG